MAEAVGGNGDPGAHHRVGAQSYQIDPAHTYPNFTVRHLGFSIMSGQFTETSGRITRDPQGDQTSLKVTIQTDSIDTGHPERDEHLRSDEFFNLEQYPEMTYQSREVVLHDENTATVFGDLTPLGETNPVTLRVYAINCGENPLSQKPTCGFNAVGVLKRSDFGMTTALPAVGDKISLRIEAEAIRH